MKVTEDGTAYCMTPAALLPDEQARKEKPCRDSANTPVAGPKLLPQSAATHFPREDRHGLHEPRVCVFVGTAFKDSHTKNVTEHGTTVRQCFTRGQRGGGGSEER